MSKYIFLRLLLNLFEFLASITGLLYWYKVKKSYWRWFSIYILIIVITEFLAEYAGIALGNTNLNYSINIFFTIPLQFIFFFWLFYKYFNLKKEKKWPVIGLVIYVGSFLLEIAFFDNKILWFFSFSYLTGNIVLLMLVLFFLNLFIHSEQILQYRFSMMFWVSLGLLFFYLGTLPFFGLWNTLLKMHPTIFNYYWMVQMSLNCLMYVFFTIAFIWGNPK